MALAPDNSAQGSLSLGGTGSGSFAYTMGAGAGGYVAIALMASGNTLSGVTYGGVAMTLGGFSSIGSRNMYWYYLENPPTGANNFTVSSAQHWWGPTYAVLSYTGAAATTAGNFTASTGVEAGSVNFTTTLTTLTPNSWGLLFAFVPASGDTIIASTGTTSRSGGGAGRLSGDSNGPLAAGSNSMSVKTGGSDTFWTFMVEVEPLVATSPTARSTIVGQAINRSNSY